LWREWKTMFTSFLLHFSTTPLYFLLDEQRVGITHFHIYKKNKVARADWSSFESSMDFKHWNATDGVG
jgi:hypothetical protein